MSQESTYREKFARIQTWIPRIIDEIKKDLRNEHLKKDAGFVRQHFTTKNPNKITGEEMVAVYQRIIAGGHEPLGEYIATRWLLKHSDLYQFFEQELMLIDPNFSDLAGIESSAAHAIMERSIREYGATDTYLFCVLNSVVFPDAVYRQLETLARQQTAAEAAEAAQECSEATPEQSRQDLERALLRLTDRYEKKIQGLEKKYATDTESLRRQVGSLQRKLAELTKG